MNEELTDQIDRLFTSEQELLAENARLRALLEEALDSSTFIYDSGLPAGTDGKWEARVCAELGRPEPTE